MIRAHPLYIWSATISNPQLGPTSPSRFRRRSAGQRSLFSVRPCPSEGLELRSRFTRRGNLPGILRRQPSLGFHTSPRLCVLSSPSHPSLIVLISCLAFLPPNPIRL